MKYLLALLLCYSASVGQVAQWKRIADPWKVFLPLRIDQMTILPRADHTAMWKDERIVISGMRPYFDSVEKEYKQEILIVESVDTGTTWSVISVIRDDYVGQINYTPGGDVFVIRSNQRLRYNRANREWEDLFQSPKDQPTHGHLEFRESPTFLMKVPGSLGIDNYYASSDDGRTVTVASAPASWYTLDDGTEVSAGMRRSVGWDFPEVRYSGSSPPTAVFVNARPLGLVFQGDRIGDDNGRTWSKRRYSFVPEQDNKPNMRCIDNGTFVAARGRLEYRQGELATSTDMGLTWSPSVVDDNNEPVHFLSCFMCEGTYAIATPSGEVYKAVPTKEMSADLRWPADGSPDRSWAQTMVCPANTNGEIRLQVALDSEMQNIVLDTIATTRAILFSDAMAHTRYYWRYAWRASVSDAWQEYTSVWSWSTGALEFFMYLGDNEKNSSAEPLATIMMDGRIVRVLRPSRRMISSSDGGKTWDSLGVVPGKDQLNHLWESPGGKLYVSSATTAYEIDVISGGADSVLPYGMPHSIGNTPEFLFGVRGRTTLRSTDDGRTWEKIKDWAEYVGGLIFDVDGNVLFGCSYWFSQAPPPYPSYHVGGLRKYDVVTGEITAVSPNHLPPYNENAVSYDMMQRLRTGQLLILDYTQGSDYKLSSDGVTWTKVPDGFFPRSMPPGLINQDRDGALVTTNSTYPIMRQLEDGNWEKLFDGIVVRDTAVVTTPNYGARVHRARDGSFIVFGTWLLTTDASFRSLRPKHRSTVQPGTIELAWKPVQGALRYNVEVQPTGVAYQAMEARVSVPIEQAGTYTWRFQSVTDSGKTSEWSAPARFTVQGTTSVRESAASTKRDSQNSSAPLAMSAEQLRQWLHGTTYTIHTMLGIQVRSHESVQPGLYSVILDGASRVVLVTEY